MPGHGHQQKAANKKPWNLPLNAFHHAMQSFEWCYCMCGKRVLAAAFLVIEGNLDFWTIKTHGELPDLIVRTHGFYSL